MSTVFWLNLQKLANELSMVWPRPALLALFNYYPGRRTRLCVEIDEHTVGKNYPQAKSFFMDVLDGLALHRLETHYSFYLRSDHSFEIVLLVRRCRKSATADF